MNDNYAGGVDAGKPSKYVPPIERKSGWDEYFIRDSLKTLTEAEKIRANKPLLAAIRKEAKKQLDSASKTHKTLQGAK
jgi:hypothetical protein